MRWIGVGLVGVWLVVDAARVADWHDELRLWASAVEHAPQEARPRANLAVLLAVRYGIPPAVLHGTTLTAAAARVVAHADQMTRFHEEDFQAWFQGEPLGNIGLSRP